MKTKYTFHYLAVFAALLLFQGCGKDEDPEKEHEEEVITTLKLTFTEGSNSFSAVWKDSDGNGANKPVVDNIELKAGTTYNVSLELLNESESPAENITEEIAEEAEEHQFFFKVTPQSALTIEYADQDGKGNPIGLKNKVTTGVAGSGTLAVILRHEPNKTADKVKTGDITNAGGSTDIETNPGFSVVIK